MRLTDDNNEAKRGQGRLRERKMSQCEASRRFKSGMRDLDKASRGVVFGGLGFPKGAKLLEILDLRSKKRLQDWKDWKLRV